MENVKIYLQLFIILLFLSNHSFSLGDWTTFCGDLQAGQYLCNELNIDHATQQLKDCNKVTLLANITCFAVDGINCTESGASNFTKEIPCSYTNGYTYETALILSIFLGMFGIDRIYLGYYAIGLAKFCTLGFLFFGQLVDIILIATQYVGPADGSSYVISYYGAGLNFLRVDNQTYKMPQEDWLL